MTFSAFSNALLFNYWNSSRDSILKNFLEENIPFILSENNGYTAYSGTAINEEDIRQEAKSIFFNEHPHFKSTYKNVAFSLLLKKHNEKCVGHFSAQASFNYETNNDLEISLNQLKAQYLDFPNTKIISSNNNIIELNNTVESGWPSSVYLKIKKEFEEPVLLFSATELFF